MQYILGTGNSCFSADNPILDLFNPDAIKPLELETEPDGSISHGETRPCCLLVSISSHLTCKSKGNVSNQRVLQVGVGVCYTKREIYNMIFKSKEVQGTGIENNITKLTNFSMHHMSL